MYRSTPSSVKVIVAVFCLTLAAVTAQAQIASCFPGNNTITTCVGGGTAGGAALSVDLPGPTSAIRDNAGNTYVAAPYSTYVFKVNSGTVTTLAGLGFEQYSGDGGQAGAAGLALPNGLSFDTKGNILIADPGNPRVRAINTGSTAVVIGGVTIQPGEIETVAGNGERCEPSTGTCGDGGLATNANLNFPMEAAVDNNGNIYIADAFDNRIRFVSAATGKISTYAGNGNTCTSPTSACGDGGAPTSATLNYPQSLMLDGNGNLFIADTLDNRIRMINTTAASPVITTVVGKGAACAPPTGACGDGGAATSANLHMPMWVYVDANDNLYIADNRDNRVRFVSGSTQIISTVAGTGYPGYYGDGGSATSALLNGPSSVFLDSNGNLVITDTGNQVVRQVSGGTISTIIGGGLGNDGGPATNGILANPYNIAIDAAGDIYIADTANNRVRFISAATDTITTVAGVGRAGYTGDNGPATSATLNGPTAVAVDASGNLWIADSGNLVIREVTASNGYIQTVAGTGAACTNQTATTGACGDGGAATSATFVDPLSITLDSADDLFIADFDAHRVREVNATTQTITTIAGVGVSGHAGNGGPATKAHLDHPADVAVDSAGNVYITDDYNNQVRQINTAGTMNAYAFNNGTTLEGDGGLALDASMWGPIALVVDAGANVFIGGGNDNVVQRVDATSLTVGTVAGDYGQKGAGGYTGDGGLATSAKLSNVGLAVDSNNHLYIADAGNNRIRTVLLAPSIVVPKMPQTFARQALGTSSTPKAVALSNSGGADLTGLSFGFGGADPGDFSQTNTCGTAIAVDVKCDVGVTFTPQGYGNRSATLQISDNESGSPQMVTLSGTGPDYTITPAPNTLTVSPGDQGQSVLTLAPLGGFNQTVTLTCLGAPKETTCKLSSTSVTLDGTDNGTSTVKLTVGSTTTPGIYNVTVKSIYSNLSHPATIQLTVP